MSRSTFTRLRYEMASGDGNWKKRPIPRAERQARLPHHRPHHDSENQDLAAGSEEKGKPPHRRTVPSHGTRELNPVDTNPFSTQPYGVQPFETTGASQPVPRRQYRGQQGGAGVAFRGKEKDRGGVGFGSRRAESGQPRKLIPSEDSSRGFGQREGAGVSFRGKDEGQGFGRERISEHPSSQPKKLITAEDSSRRFGRTKDYSAQSSQNRTSQAGFYGQRSEQYGDSGYGADRYKKPDHQDLRAKLSRGANRSTSGHSFQATNSSDAPYERKRGAERFPSDSHSSSHPGKPEGPHKGQGKERDKSWFDNVQSFSFKDIMSLREMPAGKLVNELSSKIKKFQGTLQRQPMLEKPGIMDAIIVILSKISSTLALLNEKASQILAEVLSERCPTFQLRLKLYVSQSLLDSKSDHFSFGHTHTGNLTLKRKVETLSQLFKELLTSLPGSSWSCLPIDEFQNTVEQLAEKGDIDDTLLCTLRDILMLRDAAREQHSKQSRQKRSEGGGWDNSEYKEVQILPKWDEVCISKKPERLRKNIISGSYSDWLHYYDVQFRLLREDFIAPLRNGVCDYLGGARGRKLKNVRVYQNVLIIQPAFAHTGLCYKIKLDFSHMRRRCNWAHSKRLLHGSLLCLSPEYDNFNEEVYFATVTDRDPEKLENGELEVMFQDNAQILSFSCTDTRFTLVESCAYFEASRHILRSLQTAEVNTMPFTAHLIAGNCDSVNQPRYLRERISTPYNLSFLLTDEERALRADIRCDAAGTNLIGVLHGVELDSESDQSDLLSNDEEYPMPIVHSSSDEYPMPLSTVYSSDDDSLVDVSGLLEDCFLVNQLINFKQWPSSDQTELDHSQMKALQMGLTQEIAVIQGPPGTGKTYIGLKIVEGLLLNEEIWKTDGARSPILVMCFTNHALDQFLEGILNGPLYRDSEDDNVKVVRIGSRSRSERIADLNIKKCNAYLERHVLDEKRTAANRVSAAGLKSKKMTENYYRIMKNCQHILLKDLDNILYPFHYSQLFYCSRSEEQQFLALEIWLSFYSFGNKYIKEAYSRMIEERQQQEEEASTKTLTEDPNTTTMEEHQEELQVEEESDSDSLIDITGEAAIEQSGRILDEAFDHPKREVNFVNDSGNFGSYIFTLKQHHNSFSSPDCTETQKRYIQFNEKWVKIILELGFEVKPMTAEEASEIQNIWALSFEDRWRLYHFWRSQYLQKVRDECEAEFLTYNRLCSENEEAKKAADRYALETADIIGMTTTGAAKYQHILHQVKPRIVIVEEAAEVLESHIVSALNAGTQHLILIGDHKQLRPKPNEYELAKKYNLDVSLFERLVRNGFPHATLEYQHRMRPEIAELVKPHIYTTLSNHEAVLSYPDVRGVSTNLFFINHCQEEKEDNNLMSHSNAHEANYLVSLCRYLLQQRYTPQQITILVTYAGQLLAMRKLMPRNEFEGVRVSTVDNFQGEENDIILLSLVRSNGDNNVGFLREENRVCVALSRARQGFYCIGNFTMLRSQVPLWDTIMSDMESKGKLGDGLVLHCSNHPETSFTAVKSQDFEDNAPKGGCLKDCTKRLSCGHVCVQKCHYSDPEHDEYVCLKSCTRKCREGHPCLKQCFDPCQCTVRVTRSMPGCDHDQEMDCYEDPSKINCTNPCKKKCPKGHHCPLRCHQRCKPCAKIVSVTMPLCGHEQKLKCYKDHMRVKCTADCSKKCKTRVPGHPCPKRCHEECGNCEVSFIKTIPECGHRVSLPCYVEPKHSKCTEPCEKTLPCDHRCSLRCGLECLSEKCKKCVVVMLPDCGHEVKVECHESQNVSKISCSKNCERTLHCGHSCINKCNKPCVEECKVQVNKMWPCGHKKKRPCYQTSDPDKYPCDSNCNKQLRCGHPCTKKCSQPCDEECMQKIRKMYPCGHENETSCSSSPSDTPCKSLCTYILACGHKCSGKCSECYGRHMHKPCVFKINVRRFCGHSLQLPCIGLTDSHPGKKTLSLTCPHTTVDKTCPEDISHTCDKPCEWNCIHYECELTCSEMCTRPICNERCQLKLKCGHQCFGLCGEPCLRLCPDCQRKKFKQKLKFQGEFTKDNQYYQLVCGHIFSIKYLDEYVDKICMPKSAESMLIHPLLCPVKECSAPFMHGYRYGNQVKLLLKYVQDVNTIVQYVSDNVPADDIGSLLLKGRIEKVLSPTVFQCTENFHRTRLMPATKGAVIQKGRAQVHVCYLPIPEISATLYKLQSHDPRSKEESYLLFLFIEVLKLFEKLWSPGTKNDTLKDVKKVAKFIWNNLLSSSQYRLSYQNLIDSRSALFRVYLEQCIKLAKDSFEYDDDDACLVEAETFLKSKGYADYHITKTDFELHMDAIGIDCKELLTDLDAYWPDVYKGQWWRCAKGHYYCSPPSVLVGIELKCPQCKGKQTH